jgi:hypothetical protein
LVTLVATDGGSEHAICICGGLIFDSTAPMAVPLTKEMLDWSCINGFKTTRGGYQFAEQPKTKTKNKKVKQSLSHSIFNEPFHTIRQENVLTSTSMVVSTPK